MKQVYFNILNNYELTSSDTVVVAVSGGPDSMALLSLLIEVKNKLNFKIVCAHVNHHLRAESEQEKVMVEDYCLKNNVIFEYMEILNYNKGNFHADARKQRYDFFNSLVNKYQAKYLFTAHHADDLAETILMRINRGSTIQGYAGFPKISNLKDYKIVRPLINVSKDYLLSYAIEKRIPYAIDNSNVKDVYTRNRIRKYIIPILKKENNKVLDKFNQFSETLLDYYNYVDKIVLEKYNFICGEDYLDVSKFIKEEKLIQINILRKWMNSYYKDEINKITNRHVNAIYDLIVSSNVNKSIILPNKVVVFKEYDKLFLKKNSQPEEYNFVFDQSINLPNNHTITRVNTIEKNSNYICLMNSDEISLPLHVRTRHNGDRMSVKGMSGKQKINDIFTDKKIVVADRNDWPIVTDNNDEIIWLPGLKKSKFDKQFQEKYDIILKYN